MRILLFGGTTEGRELAEKLYSEGNALLVCVASEAGKDELPDPIPCSVGRLDEPQMLALVRDYAPDRIIDATHPFAAKAHTNIQACAARIGLPVTRIERTSDRNSLFSGSVTWAKDVHDAVRLLRQTQGNILLTTGSNTLSIYTEGIGTDRLFVRVLPTVTSLEKCAEAGLKGSRILAMQGPFSAALNEAVYAQWDIRVLVTKDSGDIGGVREKVEPALRRGIQVIIIERPRTEE